MTQVTEPVPLLAEEPLRVEPATAELALLAKAVDKAGTAVKVGARGGGAGVGVRACA